jgi:hypothetical protein
MVGTVPSGLQLHAPIPDQELALVKRGLDAYCRALRKLGVNVDEPSISDKYLWVGYWDDDMVEDVLNIKVATMCVVANRGSLGRTQAAQSAYYLWSQVRNSVLYPPGCAAVGASAGGQRWMEGFNRVNVLEKDCQVTWGVGWQELWSPMEQLHMEVGVVHHMQQRLLHPQVELTQAEQVPTSRPLPHHHPLTPGPERDDS